MYLNSVGNLDSSDSMMISMAASGGSAGSTGSGLNAEGTGPGTRSPSISIYSADSDNAGTGLAGALVAGLLATRTTLPSGESVLRFEFPAPTATPPTLAQPSVRRLSAHRQEHATLSSAPDAGGGKGGRESTTARCLGLGAALGESSRPSSTSTLSTLRGSFVEGQGEGAGGTSGASSARSSADLDLGPSGTLRKTYSLRAQKEQRKGSHGHHGAHGAHGAHGEEGSRQSNLLTPYRPFEPPLLLSLQAAVASTASRSSEPAPMGSISQTSANALASQQANTLPKVSATVRRARMHSDADSGHYSLCSTASSASSATAAGATVSKTSPAIRPGAGALENVVEEGAGPGVSAHDVSSVCSPLTFRRLSGASATTPNSEGDSVSPSETSVAYVQDALYVAGSPISWLSPDTSPNLSALTASKMRESLKLRRGNRGHLHLPVARRISCPADHPRSRSGTLLADEPACSIRVPDITAASAAQSQQPEMTSETSTFSTAEPKQL